MDGVNVAIDERYQHGCYVRRRDCSEVFRNMGQPPDLDGDFELENIVGIKSEIGGNNEHYIFPRIRVTITQICMGFVLVRRAQKQLTA